MQPTDLLSPPKQGQLMHVQACQNKESGFDPESDEEHVKQKQWYECGKFPLEPETGKFTANFLEGELENRATG